MKILIVDDSNVIRKAIHKYIGKYDLEIVGEASNGLIAVEIFKKEFPDIVTLDITMPEMDGLEALNAMLKIRPETRIIIITAVSATKMALTAMENGAAAFISKPFNEEKLDAIMEKVIKDIKNHG